MYSLQGKAAELLRQATGRNSTLIDRGNDGKVSILATVVLLLTHLCVFVTDRSDLMSYDEGSLCLIVAETLPSASGEGQTRQKASARRCKCGA